MFVNGRTAMDGLLACTLAGAIATAGRSGDPEGAHRFGQILQCLRTEIVKADLQLVFHMVVCRGRKQYGARFGQGLEARRDIDPVPIEIAAFHHHIAEVDTEAKHNAAFLRHFPIGVAECLLQVDGALNRVDRAGEFHQHSVARDLEDAALVRRNERFKHILATGLEGSQGAGLIGFHQAAEADDISGQDGG